MMKAMKGNKAKMKKFSMITAGIIALILSAVFCTANVIHASGEDLSVADEAVSEEAAGSQTCGSRCGIGCCRTARKTVITCQISL